VTTLPPHAERTRQQSDLWSSKARTWSRWARPLEAMATRFNEILTEAAGVTPGARVLDLAGGAGEPAMTLARKVGDDGFVVSTDLVPAMLPTIRERGREAGLGGVLTVAAADMEHLPFAPASFDAVVSRFGVMFAPHTQAVADGIRRVLRPGGRTALMIWTTREASTMLEVLGTAVEAELGVEPAHPDALGPFRFGSCTRLPDALTRAGLTGVTAETHVFSPRPRLADDFWRPQLDMSWGHRLDARPEARPAIETRIRTAFAALADAEGRVPLRAEMRVVSGVAPG